MRTGRKTDRSDSPTEAALWASPAQGSAAPSATPRRPNPQRGKTRRLEFTTLETIQQEVSMYLDSLTNHTSEASVNTDAIDAALHETLRVLKQSWEHEGSRLEAFESVSALSPITLNLLLTFGSHHVTSDNGQLVLRGGPEELVRVGALLAVVRSITLSRARAAALQARRQQQRRQQQQQLGHGPLHSRSLVSPTSSSDSAATRQPSSSSFPSSASPFYSYNVHHAGSAPSTLSTTQPYTSSLALAEESSQDGLASTPRATPAAPLPRPVSRLVLLNCHAFGWLDSMGRDDYESNARTLQRVSTGLEALVRDPAYASVGRPPAPAEGRRRMGRDGVSVVPATTTVLLSDAILMDGGVPSLTLYRDSAVHMAHHQYGRGLACLVPALPPVAPPAPVAWQPITDSRGYFVDPPPPSSTMTSTQQHQALPATRMASNEESPGSSQLATPNFHHVGPPPTEEEEEEAWMGRAYHRAMASQGSTPPLVALSAPTRGESERGGAAAQRAVSPSTLSATAAALYAATDLTSLKPVNCGARTLPGMAVQAVLVAPAGPLFLHVQFDPLTASGSSSPPPPPPPSCGPQSGNGEARAATASVVEAAVLDGYRRLSGGGDSAFPFPPATSAAPHPPPHAPPQTQPRQQPPVSLDAAHSAEVVEWMLRVLRSPQAAVLVEWHLDARKARAAYGQGMLGAHASSSAVLQLLQSSAEALDESGTRTSDGQGFLELVHDTVSRFTRYPPPAMPQPDGCTRPLLFARGLELAPEGERMICEGTTVSSLQFRSL